MTGKDDLDPDRHPRPLPDNKVLHPLFGNHCTTETFSLKSHRPGSHYTHYEAHLDDPVKKTWTVSKVVTVSEDSFNPYKRKNATHTHLVKNKLNFRDAVTLLGSLEKEHKDKPLQYETLYPDAPVLGYIHYKAFAEREGYVYDTKGLPHARPNPRVLPLGCSFHQSDVDSANAHVQRPEDEFDNNGPQSKLPNAHFLLDSFTAAAHRDDYAASLNGVRAINLLDRFVDQIEIAQGHLTEYCDNYAKLGYGGLIDDADTALRLAESLLRQLRAYHVDTSEYDNFLNQCRITTYVLHAEGLYDLMGKGKGDFDANETLFQARVTQALDIFKKIDTSEDGAKTLQNMIVQTPAPTVPAAIGNFVQNYRAERPKYGQTPKPPKP
ncbi:MAG TPA: hypothetical protein VEF76_06170 [Patescibacteria group bacterium]|nr:hypothetical protein [Patescibacteria group bacterium]